MLDQFRFMLFAMKCMQSKTGELTFQKYVLTQTCVRARLKIQGNRTSVWEWSFMMYTTYRSIYKTSTTASQTEQRNHFFPLRVRFIISLVVLLFITCGSVVQALGNDDDREDVENGVVVKRILVQPGDTLWEIASTYKSKYTDTREFIYEIAQMNQLTGEILQAGEVLLVPIR